jgi:endoglucanase Acf2
MLRVSCFLFIAATLLSCHSQSSKSKDSTGSDSLKNFPNSLDSLAKGFSLDDYVNILNSSDESMDDSTNDHKLLVQVKNITSKQMKYIQLFSVYYDAAGDTVATGSGSSANLDPGATRVINVITPQVVNATRYHVDVSEVSF